MTVPTQDDGDRLPTIRLGAVQSAPVFLDRAATTAKAIGLIEEAGRLGVDVLGFPESYIPAHPLWYHFHAATSRTASAFTNELHRQAVVVGGPETVALADAARRAGTAVVIGICEKVSSAPGVLYNALLFINAEGAVLGVRRKLVPTVGERLVHVPGSGDGIRVFGGARAPISGLMCGENSNPLATFAMGSLGARVHVAAWPSFFGRSVVMQPIADVAARAIAYQNGCFVINAIAAIGPDMVERLPTTEDDRAFIESAATLGGSAIYGPAGDLLAGPHPGGEGIVVADADLERIVGRKIDMDFAGNYNRRDVFRLTVQRGIATEPILEALPPRAGDAERLSLTGTTATAPGASDHRHASTEGDTP
jgi:aliphatic nitrilase